MQCSDCNCYDSTKEQHQHLDSAIHCSTEANNNYDHHDHSASIHSNVNYYSRISYEHHNHNNHHHHHSSSSSSSTNSSSANTAVLESGNDQIAYNDGPFANYSQMSQLQQQQQQHHHDQMAYPADENNNNNNNDNIATSKWLSEPLAFDSNGHSETATADNATSKLPLAFTSSQSVEQQQSSSSSFAISAKHDPRRPLKQSSFVEHDEPDKKQTTSNNNDNSSQQLSMAADQTTTTLSNRNGYNNTQTGLQQQQQRDIFGCNVVSETCDDKASSVQLMLLLSSSSSSENVLTTANAPNDHDRVVNHRSHLNNKPSADNQLESVAICRRSKTRSRLIANNANEIGRRDEEAFQYSNSIPTATSIATLDGRQSNLNCNFYSMASSSTLKSLDKDHVPAKTSSYPDSMNESTAAELAAATTLTSMNANNQNNFKSDEKQRQQQQVGVACNGNNYAKSMQILASTNNDYAAAAHHPQASSKSSGNILTCDTDAFGVIAPEDMKRPIAMNDSTTSPSITMQPQQAPSSSLSTSTPIEDNHQYPQITTGSSFLFDIEKQNALLHNNASTMHNCQQSDSNYGHNMYNSQTELGSSPSHCHCDTPQELPDVKSLHTRDYPFNQPIYNQNNYDQNHHDQHINDDTHHGHQQGYPAASDIVNICTSMNEQPQAIVSSSPFATQNHTYIGTNQSFVNRYQRSITQYPIDTNPSSVVVVGGGASGDHQYNHSAYDTTPRYFDASNHQ